MLQVFITEASAVAEVKRFLVEKTRLNPTAFHVNYLEEIPKNEAGKTQYAALEPFYD